MRTRPIAVLVIGLATGLAWILPARAPGLQRPAAPAPACRAAQYHQFDFFLGDWDTYNAGAPTKVVARNHVTPMLDGCAVREVYQEPSGYSGESFSIYDATRHLWHQSWATNRGVLLLLDGKLDRGRMVLTATEHSANGPSTLLRGIWLPDADSVRETADRSADGGKTWKPVFDIVFRHHR